MNHAYGTRTYFVLILMKFDTKARVIEETFTFCCCQIAE